MSTLWSTHALASSSSSSSSSSLLKSIHACHFFPSLSLPISHFITLCYPLPIATSHNNSNKDNNKDKKNSHKPLNGVNDGGDKEEEDHDDHDGDVDTDHNERKMTLSTTHDDSYNNDFSQAIDEYELNQKQRSDWHTRWGLPLDRPVFRWANRIQFDRNTVTALSASSSTTATTSGKALQKEESKTTGANPLIRLHNVHLKLGVGANGGVGKSGVSGGQQYLVQGNYAYYHYMQDNFNDAGWGCAYRTLQTICSWFVLQHYVDRSVPTHREIQRALVELNDKKPGFEGSQSWIGAIELGMVLQHLYQVQSKTLFVSSGAEIASKARELAHHFETQGTPVMIGGGQLAYGLLGIDFNANTGDVRFLILDPHYTGSDQFNPIVAGGKWCGWKNSDLFIKTTFYNFCLPLRPAIY